MTDNGFCKGVEILLGRMHSHPEEFEMGIVGHNYGQWQDVNTAIIVRKTGQYPYSEGPQYQYKTTPLPTLTEKEIDALYERLMEIQAEAFTKEIVRRTVLASEQEQYQSETADASGPSGVYTGKATLKYPVPTLYPKDRIS